MYRQILTDRITKPPCFTCDREIACGHCDTKMYNVCINMKCEECIHAKECLTED